VQALVFRYRGALLAIPAVALAAWGKPSAFSITLGLPLAIGGELIRCWAVGYSGTTTRGDEVEAPELVTAGPYAYVRNPLYVGNFLTAAGFAFAFTGKNSGVARTMLIGGSLAAMIAVYATIVPHEQDFLRDKFGADFDRYIDDVPAVIPRLAPAPEPRGTWKPEVIRDAERSTFVTFGAMLGILALKALFA
jgi:protein-S-isoprenylcysteine O-methyltransferase Ste14